MKKKFKVTLVVFLVVVLGCFSQVFAATNQNAKLSRIVKQIKNVKLLDTTTTNSSTQNEEVDQYTKLLMHMDDNTFKDECGNTVTNNGVTVDTANKKNGNSSAYFSGSDSNLKTTISNFSLTNKFTVDFWVYPLSLSNNQYIFSVSNTNNSNYFGVYIDSIGRVHYSSNTGGDNSMNATSFVKPNTWNHIALIVYANNTIYEATNGIFDKRQGAYESNGLLFDKYTLTLGCKYDNSSYLKGNLDDFRVSNIERWTENFNPSSATLATGISLNKTADSLNVNGTDTLTATVTPDDATNKTVKWTSSDPNIVKVDENTGVMTAGTTAGTAVITATTTDGSNLSASCTVTVTDSSTPTNNSDKAVLNITMTNGQVKQYNVTMDTVNKFISWYRLRSAGSGDPFYEFDITQTSSPDIIKTDYVVFDKISSFEVDDYTK